MSIETRLISPGACECCANADFSNLIQIRANGWTRLEVCPGCCRKLREVLGKVKMRAKGGRWINNMKLTLTHKEMTALIATATGIPDTTVEIITGGEPFKTALLEAIQKYPFYLGEEKIAAIKYFRNRVQELAGPLPLLAEAKRAVENPSTAVAEFDTYGGFKP